MIKAQNLTKSFGQLIAVDDVSFEVGSGELFGFLGPNGAGKTTTINMLTGLITPSSGSAIVGGFDLRTQKMQIKQIIGIMPDKPSVYENLTGSQFVQFVASIFRVDPKIAVDRMQHFFDLFDISDFAHELIKSYSHGMQKKILLTSVLVHEPQIFFLDEPTSGLDPRSAKIVREILRDLVENGKTVFMTTHILEVAERICDRIVIINRGKIASIGTIDDLRQNLANSENTTLEDIFLQLTEND